MSDLPVKLTQRVFFEYEERIEGALCRRIRIAFAPGMSADELEKIISAAIHGSYPDIRGGF